MKKIEDLKTELFQKLAKYPNVESFFRDSLQERIKIDYKWTENIVAQGILDEKYGERSPLNTLLESISDDLPNFQLLQNKLTPRDDYDYKIKDVLAELNGYYHLRKSGFTEITALRQSGIQKTPDFSAKFNNQSYLFEVKNMRAPVEVSNILFDKLNERKLLIPEIYKNLKFEIEISNNWDQIEFSRENNQTLKLEVIIWLHKLFYLIEAGEELEKISSTFFVRRLNEYELRIECGVKRNDIFSVMIGPKYGFSIDSRYKMEKLMPFVKKVVRIVDNGLSQLLEYNQEYNTSKYILINWQKPGYVVLLQEEKYHNVIKCFDNLVKNISDNLYVKLLNADNLP